MRLPRPTVLIAMLASLALAPPGGALILAGKGDVTGQPRDVVVAGSLAYVADGAGLAILDLTDPMAPLEVGHVSTSVSNSVAVQGTLAYVTESLFGLTIVDVATPTAPSVQGTLTTPGSAVNVAVVGPVAYVADSSQGLRVVDVSISTAPTEIANVPSSGSARDVVVNGDFAYVAESSGVRIVDVSTPALAASVGTVAGIAGAHSLALEGDRLYVGADYPGAILGVIAVFDVSVPNAPVLLGDTQGFPAQVPIGALSVESGTVLGVATAVGALYGWDLSDPGNPVGFSVFAGHGTVFGVDQTSTLAYVATFQGSLDVVETAVPTRPTTRSASFQSVGRIAVGAGVAYLSAGSWLRVVDVSNPDVTPTLVTSVPVSNAGDLALLGDHLYLLSGTGLRSFDVSTPAAPMEVGSLDLGPEATAELEGLGSRIYVGGDSLRVVDVSTPTAPALLGSLATTLSSVEVAGTLVVGGENGDGLRVVDVSNPALPVAGGVLALPNLRDLAFDGDYAYVVESGRFTVVDVSNPASPVERGSAPFPGSVSIAEFDVEVSKGVVFAGWQSGIYAFDASDPDAPALLGATGPLSGDFEIHGGLHYGGNLDAELTITDFGPEYDLAPREVPMLGTLARTLLAAGLLAWGTARAPRALRRAGLRGARARRRSR